MYSTKYKSRKNRKRALGSNQRPVNVAHRHGARVVRFDNTAPMFGIGQYLSLALAAMRRPFRSRNR